jgi:phosphatidylglycerol:prolipoprotein diacylglycerol transferase
MILALPFPLVSPIAIDIGPIKIYWYGLAYVMGTLFAWWYGRSLLKKFPNGVSLENLDDTVVWILISAIVGGRLGYILFYDPFMIIQNPLEILMLSC